MSLLPRWSARSLTAPVRLVLFCGLLLVGLCTLSTGGNSGDPPADAGIDLLAEPSSPNLNLTSAETLSSETADKEPAAEPVPLPAEILNEPAAPVLAPEPIAPPANEPMDEARLDNVVAIPAVLAEDISIRMPHRGDTPMIHHWKMLGLQTILVGALTFGSGNAGEQKSPEPVKKDDPVAKQLQELKTAIDDLKKLIETEGLNTNLKVEKTQADIVELRREIDKLKEEVSSLRKTLTTTQQKSFMVEPNGKAAGRIRLVNTYTDEVTILVNNRVYRLMPQETRLTEPLPAGLFTYEVLGVQPPRTRSLLANETFTINVYTRY